jgi:hypothetical protein
MIMRGEEDVSEESASISLGAVADGRAIGCRVPEASVIGVAATFTPLASQLSTTIDEPTL